MKKVIVASNNKKKIIEIKNILKELNLEVKSLEDENINIDVVEDGKTFEENSKKKAKEIYEFLLNRGDKDFIVLADDSGLKVDFLLGEPGIYSARYAGEHGNDSKNNELLLNNLNGVKKEDRGAEFVCDIALFTDSGEYFREAGNVRGYIIEEIQGEKGFGYDPLFFYEKLNKTFAQLSAEEKNRISHRAIALEKIKKVISQLI